MAIDLCDVPKGKQTYEMCLASVMEDAQQLKFVCEKYQTEDVCLEAVKQNGDALYYVKDQTPEICLAAVKQDGWALEYVKEQTPEICLAAVKRFGLTLQYVKEQTPEICLAAVKQNGWALGYVNDPAPEICLEAVKQNGLALEYIPKRKQTLPIAIAALKQDPDSRNFLADEFRTPEVYKAAGYDYKPEDLASPRRSTERERTELKH